MFRNRYPNEVLSRCATRKHVRSLMLFLPHSAQPLMSFACTRKPAAAPEAGEESTLPGGGFQSVFDRLDNEVRVTVPTSAPGVFYAVGSVAQILGTGTC